MMSHPTVVFKKCRGSKLVLNFKVKIWRNKEPFNGTKRLMPPPPIILQLLFYFFPFTLSLSLKKTTKTIRRKTTIYNHGLESMLQVKEVNTSFYKWKQQKEKAHNKTTWMPNSNKIINNTTKVN